MGFLIGSSTSPSDSAAAYVLQRILNFPNWFPNVSSAWTSKRLFRFGFRMYIPIGLFRLGFRKSCDCSSECLFQFGFRIVFLIGLLKFPNWFLMFSSGCNLNLDFLVWKLGCVWFGSEILLCLQLRFMGSRDSSIFRSRPTKCR